MSSSYHKAVMCGVCGKVMRDNNLKRHMSAKHGSTENVVQRGEGYQPRHQSTFGMDAHTEDVRHDRPLDNNLAEAKNRDILQSIQQPEQRKMLKRYHLAQNALLDDDANTALLRDRQGSDARLLQNTVMKKRRIDDGEAKTSETAMTDAAVIDMLPASQKMNALKLLRLLRAHGDEVVS